MFYLLLHPKRYYRPTVCIKRTLETSEQGFVGVGEGFRAQVATGDAVTGSVIWMHV